MHDFVNSKNKNKAIGAEVEAEIEIGTDRQGDIHVIDTTNPRVRNIQEDTQETEIDNPKAQMVGVEEEAKTEAMIEMIQTDIETIEMVGEAIEIKDNEIETEIKEIMEETEEMEETKEINILRRPAEKMIDTQTEKEMKDQTEMTAAGTIEKEIDQIKAELTVMVIELTARPTRGLMTEETKTEAEKEIRIDQEIEPERKISRRCLNRNHRAASQEVVNHHQRKHPKNHLHLLRRSLRPSSSKAHLSHLKRESSLLMILNSRRRSS